ncbi:MAG: hypothetical protein Q8Q81_05705 [Oxalobacteraceae bacterium]|nr:hypothetical protein [Oxalobacteraceae bacterium]
MNKSPTPKSDSAATPEPVLAVAEPAPAVVKAAKAATAVTPSKTAAVTKVARVGRPPAAKTTVVKKAAVRNSVKAPVAKAAAPAVKPQAAAKPAAAVKAKKAKLVRDSFTMPEVEYAVLGKVKKASLKAGFNVRKSELLRIGVALVDQLSAAQLQAALAGLMPLKAGRPKKDK